jgi:hypothetical protein
MVDGVSTQRALTGREVVDMAIEALDRRAQYARSIAAAYGPENVGAEIEAQFTLDDALANLLRTLKGRAACAESDLPRTKEGKVQFMAEYRWKDARELLQCLAGSVRDAYTPRPVAEPQEAAHAA